MYIIRLKKDNKYLEQKRQESRKATTHWHAVAEKRLLKSSELQSVDEASAERILDANKLQEALKKKDMVIGDYKRSLPKCSHSYESLSMKKKTQGKRGGGGSWGVYVV